MMRTGQDVAGALAAAAPVPSLDRIERVLRGRGGNGENSIGARPAAVLVPLCMADGELSVLFIRRSMNLPNHPGQPAFPGGPCAAVDAILAAPPVSEPT